MSSSTQTRDWYAACPRGLENLLASELQTFGAQQVRETMAGVAFEGPLVVAYRACLWTRLANRVLLPLAEFPVESADDLYEGVKAVAWGSLFQHTSHFALDFSGTNHAIRNTRFGVQKSKDAIMDWFRENGGQRPRVAARDAQIRFSLRLARDRVSLALDMSGGSLHQRGYRSSAGKAPMKENLAAALLLRADWPGMASRGGALIDPMCGSATLLLEGAMMAADIAPGLARRRFGFEHWSGHNPDQWRALVSDARSRADRGKQAQLPEIRGYDADPRVVRVAQENIARAGLEKVVRVSCKPLAELKKPTHKPLPQGLLICNPPYGERLGEKKSLAYLYRQLGETFVREFKGWQAGVFTADLELGKAIGLRSHKRYALFNGALPAHLLLFELENNTLSDKPLAQGSAEEPPPTGKSPSESMPEQQRIQSGGEPEPLSEGAQMFANRIRKNRKRLASWLKREQISCYRLYDADMPEYAVAVDMYEGAVHVAEYQAPKGVDESAAERRMEEIRAALPEALGVAGSDIAYKQRRRQRGAAQYEKMAQQGEFITVREGTAKLLVNLRDYLDTGLFLDHRPLRRRIAAEVSGKTFLNLFCYTGSATVLAALGGASRTVSVDMSNTYLSWLRNNLAANGLAEGRHQLVKANCLQWLEQGEGMFDIVLLDPPSFSNSTGMENSFDVQRDQLALVTAAMQRVSPEGRLYFSNNRRRFKLSPELTEAFDCTNSSPKTLDPDFARNPKIHQCWLIAHKNS